MAASASTGMKMIKKMRCSDFSQQKKRELSSPKEINIRVHTNSQWMFLA